MIELLPSSIGLKTGRRGEEVPMINRPHKFNYKIGEESAFQTGYYWLELPGVFNIDKLAGFCTVLSLCSIDI